MSDEEREPVEIEGLGLIADVTAELVQSGLRTTQDPEAPIVNARIGEVIVAAELLYDDAPDPDDPEAETQGYSRIFYRCSNSRKWVQRGLLQQTIEETRS